MDHNKIVYIIWTLKPLNDWTPAHEMAIIKKNRSIQLILVFEAVLTIQDVDIDSGAATPGLTRACALKKPGCARVKYCRQI